MRVSEDVIGTDLTQHRETIDNLCEQILMLKKDNARLRAALGRIAYWQRFHPEMKALANTALKSPTF